MTAAGYLLVCVFACGPLVCASVLTVRGRSRALWLLPLWAAVLGSVSALLWLLGGQRNLPQQNIGAEAIMACGVTAWVLLVPTVAFPHRPSPTAGQRRTPEAIPGTAPGDNS